MSSEEVNNCSNDYLRNLNSLLATDRRLLTNLRSYKSEIVSFSNGLRESRKVSTTMKIVGGASVIAGTVLIPFTAGTSSALIGVGTTVMLSGRVMDVVRNFVDSTKTQEQMAELRRYAEEHDRIANELQIGMVKLVDCLGLCASNKVTLKPTRYSFVTMALAVQCGLLIPSVREYVQKCLTSSLSCLFPSVNTLNFVKFANGLAITLNCLAAVCTVIESIYEFQEIFENKPHPSEVKAQSLIDAISGEIDQLLIKIELFAD